MAYQWLTGVSPSKGCCEGFCERERQPGEVAPASFYDGTKWGSVSTLLATNLTTIGIPDSLVRFAYKFASA
jgi:hypothetical protein